MNLRYCLALLIVKRSSSSSSSKPALKAGSGHCNSVILLSPGRTATDTVSHTLVASSPLSYCHGTKEFFGHHTHRVKENLFGCRSQYPHGVYIHVKPEHISPNTPWEVPKPPPPQTMKSAPSRVAGNTSVSNVAMNGRQRTFSNHSHADDSLLKTPEAFFSAAKEVGFGLVVTSFRDNQLARAVSSFELTGNTMKGTARFMSQKLVASFEDDILEFNRAVSAAHATGFRVLAITFDEIVGDLCRTAKRIANAAGCSGAQDSSQKTSTQKDGFACRVENGHTEQSHHGLDLVGRVGAQAAQGIVRQLTGTPYEWMLDLNASSWPSGTPRPVSPLGGSGVRNFSEHIVAL
mmetsp:Transcript_11949/g.23713  ORF Transcript_11949/g.23713 Transcript_11949/m.23713 type:complete len:348 (+) Transcript_11949:99-1142(+)